MPSILDNDVERPSTQPQFPMTDLVRTYLQQAGSKFYGPGAERREEPQARTVHDLWDYLGDFA